jgi:hypothetical protein
MRKLISLLTFNAIVVIFIATTMSTSCTKEGPAGLDANQTCKQCHKPSVVEEKAAQFEFSKHSYGEAAFEEAGNTGCTPCHSSDGFNYVCKNNVSADFIQNPALAAGKYMNGYATVAASALGEFSCGTCHPNLHTAYDSTDFYPLTNIKAVAMTMYGGTKTIDLTQKGGEGNLCVKCHQPRPITTSTTTADGKPIDYASLATNLTGIFYDKASSTNKVSISYRTGVHYGATGAIYAGKGAIEFTGSSSYTSSAHTAAASCQDCHMANVSNRAGGHTFMMRGTTGGLGSTTTWNFNGCNVSGCHSTSPIDANSTKFKDVRASVKTLLETLAGKIKNGVGGVELMHRDATDTNLWLGITTNNYDGYLDLYDASLNPTGKVNNPDGLNPIKPITNLQMGAIINFQLCLREYSLGIHNTAYTKALLNNTIAALTAAGF